MRGTTGGNTTVSCSFGSHYFILSGYEHKQGPQDPKTGLNPGWDPGSIRWDRNINNCTYYGDLTPPGQSLDKEDNSSHSSDRSCFLVFTKKSLGGRDKSLKIQSLTKQNGPIPGSNFSQVLFVCVWGYRE